MDLDLILSVVTPEVLKGFSDEELITLADEVGKSSGIELVTKDERGNAIEKTLAKKLNLDYLKDLLDAADREIAKLAAAGVEMGEVNKTMSAIGAKLDARDLTTAKKLLDTACQALAILGKKVIKEIAGTRTPAITISASFSQADLAAIKQISKQQLWWIGDLWNDHLTKVITETVRKEALVTGLGRTQVGEILKGVVGGTVKGAFVPGTWRGSTESYFQMLAGTVRNQASTFGSISGMGEAGFTRYIIQAVMDERTSTVCRELNLREFTVQDGENHIERVNAVTDPDQLKSVAGWRKLEEVKSIIGSGDSESQRRSLASAGLALPPYHARCRTTVVPA